MTGLPSWPPVRVSAGSRVPFRERAARADTRAATFSRCQGDPSTSERLSEATEDRQVGVQLHAGESPDAKGREAVFVLQPSEFTLYRDTTTVEGAEAIGVALNARVGGRGS